MVTYAEAGVNIELGDLASKIFYEAAKETWKNRKEKFGEVIELFDDFSGLRGIDVGGLPKGTVTNLGFDGVATKVEVAERVGRHDTVAYDLFAMVCDDAVIRGAEPVLIGSIFDVNTLGNEKKNYIPYIRELVKGYIKAAEEANVCVVNGEVAELGARISGYGSFNYNWGAGVAWFAKKERLIGGKKIKPGDKVVALYEEGFRSNGFSLVRKIMKNNFSENWTDKCFDGKSVGERALTPSRIYTRAIVDMTGGFDGEEKVKINGMAHITGGGIPGKLGRLLKPSGFGADLENLFSPSEFVKFVQQQGKVPDKEAYKTWNMGNGMLIVTREPKKVIEIAKLYGIESREVGVITENSIIKIISKGFYSEKNQSLNFDL